jgi:hypothetical protein
MADFPRRPKWRQWHMLIRRFAQFAGLMVGTVVVFFTVAMMGLLMMMLAVLAHH